MKRFLIEQFEKWKNPGEVVRSFYDQWKNPKRGFRKWTGVDLNVEEMSEEERLNILYVWFARTTFTYIVIMPTVAWLFPEDLLLDYVVMNGSLWQAYLVLIIRFLLMTSIQVGASLSQGVGPVIVFVVKEWFKKR
ncbi:hypothetical protein [Exiguobacterium sp. s133]|uniref:hypothetical protein n=1 Tax=Exiguobacterium sp. s133 TaxID=2751213 RepID=UPI001BE912E0|nr:hypothetical protein [Exiguobacterium sp. s133]